MTTGAEDPAPPVGTRREVLRKLLAARAAGDARVLSAQQERLWIAHRLDPGDPSQNLRSAVWIHGELDEAALERCLSALVRNHEQLRARFFEHQGIALARIRSDEAVELRRVDLAHLDPSDRDTGTERAVRREASRPFDLLREPPLRAALLVLGDTESVLVLTVHHIVCDAWSMEILLRQLAEIYPSTVRGGAPRPPAPAGAYADFVEAQLAASSDGSTDRAVSFWRRRLKGYATDSPLPRRLSEDAGAHGARRLEIDWPAEVLAGAQRLAARHGATLYMVLLSAFAALLHRLSGRDDLVVASPVTNREREEWESVVGYFVNLLPLRLRWPAETPFTELLAVTRETVIEAQTHQRLPIHQIAAAASLRPRALVHVLYQHVAAPRERIRAGGIVLTPKPIDLGRTRHDLTLSTFAAAGRLGGTLEYDRRALDDTSARQLVDALAATLEQVLDDPSVAPATLEIPHAWTREPEPPAKPAGRDDAPAPSTGAATSDLEARLAGIWQEVLEVEPVSRWDNFLDIGGDSLTAMQVIESVERSLGVRLAPGDLFTQTLAQLAASCERRRD